MRICPKDWFCEVSVWFHIQIQTSITVFGYFTVLHLVLIFLFANMHLLITKYSIPPLNKCMTFLAHGISVFFIRKIRARVRTHKNCVDELKILDRLGEWRTGNSFFLFFFFFVPGLTRRKNYKVYKLTNQYPQRGGTKAVLGTCPSCCLTLICLRERAVNGLYELSIYVAILGDSQIIRRHFIWVMVIS